MPIIAHNDNIQFIGSKMKTSAEWWTETKSSPEKINAWLLKQYVGEATAVARLEALLEKFEFSAVAKRIIKKISADEKRHATWIGHLLTSRSIELPDINHEKERYWPKVVEGVTNSVDALAVAAHAEKMRLERIRVIAADSQGPADIQLTFHRILGDEINHADWFETLAGDEAMMRTADKHKAGMEALSLIL